MLAFLFNFVYNIFNFPPICLFECPLPPYSDNLVSLGTAGVAMSTAQEWPKEDIKSGKWYDLVSG